MFALIDCNNFYASCERLFRPDLNGKPVVVLSNNDGCVIARSNEAKSFGIPMGAPAFKYKALFEANNISVFSSNYALYGDMSGRVMSILTQFAPEIEVYSIDEAFLKLDGCDYIDFNTYGEEIKRKVEQWTGIPVSVGFAPTKSLAKAANRIAKKFPKETKGVYCIDDDEKRIKALKWLKIGDVWGIGRQHSKRLQSYGVNTAFEFTQQSDSWVRGIMSVVGLRLKKDLEGEAALELESYQDKKSIATTRTFEQMHTTYEPLKERVTTFAVSCAEKLRKQKSHCNAITVFLQTNRHREDLYQYSPSIVVKLPYPTNSSLEIAHFAITGLQKMFKEGYQYKKAGVVVMDFTPERSHQLNLFENSNPKHKALMQTIDRLNNSIGQQKVKLASQDLDRTWKMKQEKLSPRYTTQMNEIITLDCR
jgi:DNA polymerase V